MTSKSHSVTIRDIAKQAGVSVATISRYINKNAPVSIEVAERIQKVMREMNYQPHSAARHLATHHTQTIGLVFRSVHTDFFAPLLNGIETVVTENQYNLLITTEKSFEGSFNRPPIGVHNTDGILVFSDCLSNAQLTQLWNENLPLALIHRTSPPNLKIPFATVENKLSTQKMIDHLIECHNRRSIVFLRGPKEEEDTHLREQGYLASLKNHGIEPDQDLIAEGNFEGGAAYRAMKKLVSNSPIRFDAVFAGNDDAAIGVLTALSEAGLRVPEDVSVVGFDDLRISEFINPPLTTVHAPTEKVGEIAAKLLFDQIRGLPVESVTLETTEIVLRHSCGCPYETA